MIPDGTGITQHLKAAHQLGDGIAANVLPVQVKHGVGTVALVLRRVNGWIGEASSNMGYYRILVDLAALKKVFHLPVGVGGQLNDSESRVFRADNIVAVKIAHIAEEVGVPGGLMPSALVLAMLVLDKPMSDRAVIPKEE